MMLDFSAGDLAQFCELISDTTSEILFKADSEGFILQASQGIGWLGDFPGEAMPPFLIPPRVQDLASQEHVPAVEAELALAAAGNRDRGWCEFRLGGGAHGGRWYALRLVPAGERHGKAGVLGILRDVHERRMLEESLFVARMTDPLTGLTNRLAFNAMLEHVTTGGLAGSLALFRIDHFRTINHRLGHGFGDDLLAGFTRVLRTVMRTGDTVSRVGGSRFAVILLKTDHTAATKLCHEVQQVFADELRAGKLVLPLSASAGIAELSRCPQDTLRRAELALALGKGGMQIPRERRLRPVLAAMPSCAPEQWLRRAG